MPELLAVLAAAAPQLVTLAGEALQAAVNSGTMTTDEANAAWQAAHSNWQTAFAAWQAQRAKDTDLPPA